MSEEKEKNEERNWSEEIEVAGGDLVERVKELIEEGNVRRLIIRKPDGRIATGNAAYSRGCRWWRDGDVRHAAGTHRGCRWLYRPRKGRDCARGRRRPIRTARRRSVEFG